MKYILTSKKLFKSLKGVHQLELKGIETKLKEALDLQILMGRKQARGGGERSAANAILMEE